MLVIALRSNVKASSISPERNQIQCIGETTVNGKVVSISRYELFQARIVWLMMLTLLTLFALFSLKVIQGKAEVKPGQLPKETVARQTFSTTGGKRFNLESMHGKVVVMQFFGTWCGYSKRQIPTINKLIDNQKSSDLEVIGMSVKDPRSNLQAVKQFINDQKVGYPVVSEVDDKYFTQFINSTDVSVPQTLIYGRDGRLIAHYRGFNAQVGEEVEANVKTELAVK